jgi:hypothetical protein
MRGKKKHTWEGHQGWGWGWRGRERDSEQTLNILTEQSSTQGRQVQESQIHPEYSEENTHEL